MSRRADRETYVIRHKSGEYIYTITTGVITHLPDLTFAHEFGSFDTADNFMREVKKADEYTLVRVHVRQIAEQDGKKFSYNPRLKDAKEKEYSVTTRIIIEELDKKDRFSNRMISVGLYIVTPAVALIPAVMFLYDMAKKWWM